MSSHSRTWREIQEKIRPVLNSLWDPIGVADAVDDEYDSYIGGVYALLRGGATHDKIADHLLKIETVNMGLPGSSDDHRARVVSALQELALPEFQYP